MFDKPAWGIEDLRALASTLPMFRRAKSINLAGRGINPEGANILRPAFKRMAQLEKVNLKGNLLGDALLRTIAKEITDSKVDTKENTKRLEKKMKEELGGF